EFVAYELGDVEAVRELVVASGAGVSSTHALSVPAQRDPRDHTRGRALSRPRGCGRYSPLRQVRHRRRPSEGYTIVFSGEYSCPRGQWVLAACQPPAPTPSGVPDRYHRS